MFRLCFLIVLFLLCECAMADRISIQGLDKAELLANLWHRSKTLGLSFLAQPVDIDQPTLIEMASAQLAYSQKVDYFAGRVIKVDFAYDTINPWLYDRDNGPGAFAWVVDKMRSKK